MKRDWLRREITKAVGSMAMIALGMVLAEHYCQTNQEWFRAGGYVVGGAITFSAWVQ